MLLEILPWHSHSRGCAGYSAPRSPPCSVSGQGRPPTRPVLLVTPRLGLWLRPARRMPCDSVRGSHHAGGCAGGTSEEGRASGREEGPGQPSSTTLTGPLGRSTAGSAGPKPEAAARVQKPQPRTTGRTSPAGRPGPRFPAPPPLPRRPPPESSRGGPAPRPIGRRSPEPGSLCSAAISGPGRELRRCAEGPSAGGLWDGVGPGR